MAPRQRGAPRRSRVGPMFLLPTPAAERGEGVTEFDGLFVGGPAELIDAGGGRAKLTAEVVQQLLLRHALGETPCSAR